MMMDSSLLVTTRFTTLEQDLACNASFGPETCPTVYEQTSTATNYVMAAERFAAGWQKGASRARARRRELEER